MPGWALIILGVVDRPWRVSTVTQMKTLVFMANGVGVDPIVYARIFAPYSPGFARIVERHDEEERERKSEYIEKWLSSMGTC